MAAGENGETPQKTMKQHEEGRPCFPFSAFVLCELRQISKRSGDPVKPTADKTPAHLLRPRG